MSKKKKVEKIIEDKVIQETSTPTEEELAKIGLTLEEFNEQFESENEIMENVVADMEFIREEMEQKEATDDEIKLVLNEFSLIKYHAALYAAWSRDELIFNVDDDGKFQIVEFGKDVDCPHCKDEEYEEKIIVNNDNKTLN